MLKFAFLLTIWNADVPAVYVEDYGLTGTDCIQAIADYNAKNPHHTAGAPSCELDAGQPWDELPTSGVFAE